MSVHPPLPGIHQFADIVRHQLDFRVMGCAAHIVVTGQISARPPLGPPPAPAEPDLAELELADLAAHGAARLRELEGLWSRFLPGSDITRANQAAGRSITVHADTVAVVARALEAWRQTRGRFDITVLPALVRHGYTHSAMDGAIAPPVAGLRIGVCGGIVFDIDAATITVPPGGAIDLGGIGKGFAADLVAGELITSGASGALVNIGGDIAVRGTPPGATADWTINLQHPLAPDTHVARIELQRGGVATSGRTVRRWITPSGESAHHLIDPATAVPAATSLLSAAVVAGDTATAEAFATAAMLGDGPRAVAMLDSVGLAGLMVATDATVYRSALFSRFER